MFLVDADKCIGCEICVDVCPTQAILVENEIAAIDDELCSECGICVEECPQEAILES
jgi:ferredoxin